MFTSQAVSPILLPKGGLMADGSVQVEWSARLAGKAAILARPERVRLDRPCGVVAAVFGCDEAGPLSAPGRMWILEDGRRSMLMKTLSVKHSEGKVLVLAGGGARAEG